MPMRYNSPIHGLVTRDSSHKRTRSPHRRAGLTKLHDRCAPSCMRQPSLSPFTYVGFCFSAALPVRARQLMGLHGPHPSNTGTVNPQSAAQPVREGLHKIASQVVMSANNRANRGDFRALGPFTLKQEIKGPEGADTSGITLARTMDKRFSGFQE